MDARDFRIMIQRYDPWLMDWVSRRTSQFKLKNQTTDSFDIAVATKIESLTETHWGDLALEQKNPTTIRIEEGTDGLFIIGQYYTIVWQKNDEKKIRYTGTQKMISHNVSELLKLMFSGCEDGDTPWVSAVIETKYTINTTSIYLTRHSFVIYPCEERAFMGWVDQYTEEINHVLAQRGLALSSYTVVALK